MSHGGSTSPQVETRVTEDLEKIIGPLREEFAAQLRIAGATPEEAECMATVLLSVDPEEVQLHATTSKKAEIAVALCRDRAGACLRAEGDRDRPCLDHGPGVGARRRRRTNAS